MIDRADIPPELMERLIVAEIGRADAPRVVLDRFALGGFVFVDSEMLPDRMLRLEVIQKIQEALASMQAGVQCDDIGLNPHGPVESIRIGVFNSSSLTVESLVGAWYMGSIASPAADEYAARFMPYFPTIGDAEYAALSVDVCDYLINTLPTATYPARFTSLSFAAITDDPTNPRMVGTHEALMSSPRFTVATGDTPVPLEGRIEVKLSGR